MDLIQVAVFASTFGKEFLSYGLTAMLPFTNQVLCSVFIGSFKDPSLLPGLK